MYIYILKYFSLVTISVDYDQSKNEDVDAIYYNVSYRSWSVWPAHLVLGTSRAWFDRQRALLWISSSPQVIPVDSR